MASNSPRWRWLPSLLLAGLTLAWLLADQRGGGWPCAADYWEHLAVVNELAAHPAAPGHHLLAVDASHPFFSPFHLALAGVTNALGAPAETVLRLAGAFNFILFAGAFLLALTRLYPGGNAFFPTLALFFVLFAWPPGKLVWSGFLNVHALRLTSPYPSLFAAALGFFCLASNPADGRPGAVALILKAVLWALMLLLHPTTFVIFAIADFCLLFAGPARPFSTFPGRLARYALPLAAAVPLAMVWPYYPVLGLLKPMTNAFNTDSAVFAALPVAAAVAALSAAALLGLKRSRGLARSLVSCVVLAAGVYFAAVAVGQYGQARVLILIVLAVQLLAAYFASLLVAGMSWKGRLCAGAAMAVIAAYACGAAGSYAREIAADCDKDLYRCPTQAAKGRPTALTPRKEALFAAAQGFAVVASPHPVYWVADHDGRVDFVERFYKKGLTPRELQDGLARYNVGYVALKNKDLPLLAALAPYDVLCRTGESSFVALRPAPR